MLQRPEVPEGLADGLLEVIRRRLPGQLDEAEDDQRGGCELQVLQWSKIDGILWTMESSTTIERNIRASQAERDLVVERLRSHAGEGRLEVDELEQRIEAALSARTQADLDAVEADLPRPAAPRRRRRPHPRAGTL